MQMTSPIDKTKENICYKIKIGHDLLASSVRITIVFIHSMTFTGQFILDNYALVLFQSSEPNCEQLKWYIVTLKNKATKEVVYSNNYTASGEFNITDLEGFTEYTINVDAINNQNNRSSNEKEFTSVEISMFYQ